MLDEHVDLQALDPKVIAWDLDGTLWHGTIDAGDTQSPRHCAALLAEFAWRGIVNTVCSNNSPEAGLTELRRLGLDDYVVVPQIGWADKSHLMRNIVEFFQISPDRILLVDDDVKIRTRLVSEFGITAVDPAELERADLHSWGIRGAGLERLQHYRVLARRGEAQARHRQHVNTSDSGVEFLRSCGTRVHRVDVATSADRIATLSMRSNRLNFTNSRLDPIDVRRLAVTPHYVCYAVEVSDRFGSYGLCGFAAFNSQSGQLEHFFWSCRVLNQGVVEHFAAQLNVAHGCQITYAALVDFGVGVDWVSEQTTTTATASADGHRPSLLLIGGCDLDIVAALMSDTRSSTQVRGLAEANGVQQYGHSGVNVLAAQYSLSPADLAESATRLPWIGTVPDINEWAAHDVVVLSLWVDYCCMTVRYRDDINGVRVPCYKQLDAGLTDSEWEHWVGTTLTRDEVAQQLEFGPALTAEELVSGLRTLAAAMPSGTRLVLLNAAELDRPAEYEWGERQGPRNRELNHAVAAFVRESANVSLVDVAAIVTSTAQLASPDDPTGFHYRRDVYAEIARLLLAEFSHGDR